ncbi:MAG: T9SS type A sorting domain-containing protein [Candidatus Krumholzibacteriota bacterium]|nr:T9SS type A sorting domain-containing protein [Candidatus Krumholzibacteriota bacterium]
MAGYFSRDVDFGGGARSSAGSWDIAVVKLDTAFGYLWDAVRGGEGADFAYDIALLGDDHVFVAGNFEETVDFGGGQRTSAGDADIVLLELGGDGAWLWDGAWGGAGRERVQGIVLDPREGLYLAGLFSETVDFGGGDRVSAGLTDGFVARYDVDVPATVDIAPETLNLKSKGRWITCHIELMEGFDPSTIDVSTVMLGGTVPAAAKPTSVGDCDDDGIPDRMVKFDRQAVIGLLQGMGGDVPLAVTGSVGEKTFEGTGSVLVICPPVLKPEENEPAAPARTASLAAWPNPFNPTVRIAWSVPRQGRVVVQVWDVNGRLVRTIENAVRPAGDYSAEWSGRNDIGRPVSSGVYFCRVSIGGETLSRKLMLLR